MYMLYISNSFKYIISAKTEPLKFRSYLLKLSFSKPFQLMKINSTESYVFFSWDLSCKNSTEFYLYERHSIFSVRNPCVSPYRVLNLTHGTKCKYTNEH